MDSHIIKERISIAKKVLEELERKPLNQTEKDKVLEYCITGTDNINEIIGEMTNTEDERGKKLIELIGILAEIKAKINGEDKDSQKEAKKAAQEEAAEKARAAMKAAGEKAAAETAAAEEKARAAIKAAAAAAEKAKKAAELEAKKAAELEAKKAAASQATAQQITPPLDFNLQDFDLQDFNLQDDGYIIGNINKDTVLELTKKIYRDLKTKVNHPLILKLYILSLINFNDSDSNIKTEFFSSTTFYSVNQTGSLYRLIQHLMESSFIEVTDSFLNNNASENTNKNDPLTMFYKNQVANYDLINDIIFSNRAISTKSGELKKVDVMSRINQIIDRDTDVYNQFQKVKDEEVDEEKKYMMVYTYFWLLNPKYEDKDNVSKLSGTISSPADMVFKTWTANDLFQKDDGGNFKGIQDGKLYNDSFKKANKLSVIIDKIKSLESEIKVDPQWVFFQESILPNIGKIYEKGVYSLLVTRDDTYPLRVGGTGNSNDFVPVKINEQGTGHIISKKYLERQNEENHWHPRFGKITVDKQVNNPEEFTDKLTIERYTDVEGSLFVTNADKLKGKLTNEVDYLKMEFKNIDHIFLSGRRSKGDNQTYLTELPYVIENDYRKGEKKPICFIGFGQSGSGKTSSLFHLKISGGRSIDGVIPTLIKKNYSGSDFSFEIRVRELLHGGAHLARLESEGEIQIENKSSTGTFGKPQNKAEVQIIHEDKEKKTNLTGETVIKVKELIEGNTADESLEGDPYYSFDNTEVNKMSEFMKYIVEEYREVSPTMNNSVSSRSHIIINIRVKQVNDNEDIENITVCDLAGVENEFECEDKNYISQTISKIFDNPEYSLDYKEIPINGNPPVIERTQDVKYIDKDSMGMITVAGQEKVSCLPGNKSRKEPVTLIGPYLELERFNYFFKGKWAAYNHKIMEEASNAIKQYINNILSSNIKDIIKYQAKGIQEQRSGYHILTIQYDGFKVNVFSKRENTFRISDRSEDIVKKEINPRNLEQKYTENINKTGVLFKAAQDRIKEIKQLIEGVINDAKEIAQEQNFPTPIKHQGSPQLGKSTPPTIEISRINEINSIEDIEGKKNALKTEILGPILKQRLMQNSSMKVINAKYVDNPAAKNQPDYMKKLEYNKPRAKYHTIEVEKKTRQGRIFKVNFINNKAQYTTGDKTAEKPKQYFTPSKTAKSESNYREYTLYSAFINNAQMEEILNVIGSVTSDGISKPYSYIYYEIKEDSDDRTPLPDEYVEIKKMIQTVTTNYDIIAGEIYGIINEKIMKPIYGGFTKKQQSDHIKKDARLQTQLLKYYKKQVQKNETLAELLKNKIENNISSNTDGISDEFYIELIKYTLFFYGNKYTGRIKSLVIEQNKFLQGGKTSGINCSEVLRDSVIKTCRNQRKLEGQMINNSLREFNHDLRDKSIGIQKRIIYDNIYETEPGAFETCNPLIDSYNINYSREKDPSKNKGVIFTEIQNVSRKDDMLFIIITVANFTTLNVYEKDGQLITRDEFPYKYTNDPVGSSLPPYYIDHVNLEKLYLKAKHNETERPVIVTRDVLQELTKLKTKFKTLADKDLPLYVDSFGKLIDHSVKHIISTLSKHNSATLIGTLQNADQIGSLIRRNSIITKVNDVDLVQELEEYGVFIGDKQGGGKNIVDRRVLTNRKQRRVKTNRKQRHIHTNQKQRRVKTNRKQRRVHTNKKQRKVRTNRKHNIDIKKKE